MTLESIKTLADFAAKKVSDCPIEEQIPIYIALADVSETPAARKVARAMATTLSQVAALQLEFSIAYSGTPQGDGK